VKGLYLCGSSGESFLLSERERKRIVETVAEVALGRLSIVVHTGSLDTATAVSLSRHAISCGVDAISSVPPFYFKYTNREIIQYYLDIVEATNAPLVVYNIPSFTGVTLTHINARELFEHPLVVGIKYTSTDMYGLERIHSTYPNLILFNGHEEMFISALSVGADSMIGSAANFMAEKLISVKELFEEGKLEEARRIQRTINQVIEVMIDVGVFNAVKHAMSLHGFECGDCRRPFLPLTDEQKMRVTAVIEQYR
jgi:N-acetylneuraminate lyase